MLTGANLPKLEVLTAIDKIISLTTFTIMVLGVGSVWVYSVHVEKCPANMDNPVFTLVSNGTFNGSGWLLEVSTASQVLTHSPFA